jgi:hypothetical protein
MIERTPILISLDGEKSLELVEFEGEDRIPNRVAFGLYYTIRFVPDGETSRIVVVFGNLTRYAQPVAFGLPDLNIGSELFRIFAETRIGEHLDGLESHSELQGSGLIEIPCLSDAIRRWEPPRKPLSDEVVEEYVKAKLYHAWSFGYGPTVFSWPDFFRLGTTPSGFYRVVSLGEDTDWEIDALTEADFQFKPSRSFLSGERSRRRGNPVTPAESARIAFVDPSRLQELRAITSSKFDLRRLIALCEELNSASAANAVHAIAMLTRAIVDHVPPIFGAKTFAEVANNYPGAKSFRDSMQHLNNSARRIADAHLHVQIRPREVLPTRVQVDFSRDLDVLLSEIVRLL